MADETKTVIIDVEVQGKADKQIGELNTTIKENRKEIKELSKDYDKNATEIAKLERQNKNLSTSKRELTKESKIQKGSLNELRQELSKQVKERNNLNKSTEEGAIRFNKLQKSIGGLNKEISGFEQEGGDFRRNVGNYPKLLKSAGAAVKGFGLALKALGIGAVVALVVKFTEILGKNQVVADIFATAIEAVEIVLSDFVNLIVNNSGTVVAFFKDIFENPLKNIKALGKAIQDNLTGRFESLIKGAGLLGDVFTKLFEGDFKGALETAGEAALEFGDAVLLIQPSALIEGVKSLTTATVNYASSVVKAASANVELANSAKLVDANNKLLFESYDQQAEALRQIRDEERNTIDERIEANNKLSAILEEQQVLQLKQIQIQIDSAKAQVSKNNNIENEVLLTEALAEKQAILADIEGRRSEQLSNDLGLSREKQELEQTLLESTNKRALAELDFQAQATENDEIKNKRLLDNLSFELEIESERLNGIIESSKKGTQARQDAEQELLDFEQNISQKRTKIENKANADEEKREKALAKTKKAILKQGVQDLKTIMGESEAAQKAFALTAIGIDTAEAIAGLTSASESNPLNAPTLGAAGIIHFAAGMLRIGANIASAKSALSGSTSVSSSSGAGVGSASGGGLSSSSVSVGGQLSSVNASLLGQFSTAPQAANDSASATSEAVGNLPPIQVSVTDINDVNDSLNVKVSESTLG